MANNALQWRAVTKEILFTLCRSEAKNRRAVLFIHGFTGDHEATWINRTSAVSFPVLMASDAELSDYDVFSFQYRTSAVSGTSIKKVAIQLADEINERMGRYEQLVLLTHSMGGLVAMRYVLNQLAAGARLPVQGLLLYGVPVMGSHLVSMAKAAGAVLTFALPKGGSFLRILFGLHDQIEQLEPASEFIQELNDEWALRVVNGGHSSEQAKRRALLPVRVVTGTKDLVVKEVSAKGTYGSIDWHPIEYTHVNLVKPTGVDDVRYKNAKEFLASCRRSVDRDALLRLRQISDRVLEVRSQPLCRGWEYDVHLHGGAKYAAGDAMLGRGFSPFVVKACRYQTFLEDTSVYVGFSWGHTATAEAWKRKPVYVHQMLTRDLDETERNTLAKGIDEVLEQSPADSWSTLFPEITVAIVQAGARNALVAGDVERYENMILRKYSIPKEAQARVNEEATIDIQFKSYAPKGTTAFTLAFPWLHVGFKGTIVVHGQCKSFTTNQFLSGENELTLAPEYYDHKSQLTLQTDDIVLPASHVEVNWQVDEMSANGGSS